ncbi:MAG: 4Fe-4S binding protein [Anaerolineae bacterium]|nr:4Fe-4S binding protein [Anaerolineae bacterium]
MEHHKALSPAASSMFGLMFVASLFVGRLWCGWVCPAGGLAEISFSIDNQPVSRKVNWIKWLIWVPWLILIVIVVVQAGGYQRVNFLHLTETGISVDEPLKYITYYMVITLLSL